MTMSAPRSSGRWAYGVANVLSTASVAPPSRASLAAAAMSTMRSSGLVGVSIHTSRVRSVMARSMAPGSVASTGVNVTP